MNAANADFLFGRDLRAYSRMLAVWFRLGIHAAQHMRWQVAPEPANSHSHSGAGQPPPIRLVARRRRATMHDRDAVFQIELLVKKYLELQRGYRHAFFGYFHRADMRYLPVPDGTPSSATSGAPALALCVNAGYLGCGASGNATHYVAPTRGAACRLRSQPEPEGLRRVRQLFYARGVPLPLPALRGRPPPEGEAGGALLLPAGAAVPGWTDAHLRASFACAGHAHRLTPLPAKFRNICEARNA